MTENQIGCDSPTILMADPFKQHTHLSWSLPAYRFELGRMDSVPHLATEGRLGEITQFHASEGSNALEQKRQRGSHNNIPNIRCSHYRGSDLSEHDPATNQENKHDPATNKPRGKQNRKYHRSHGGGQHSE